MKTSELTGAALDWAVCKIEGWTDEQLAVIKNHHDKKSTPSTNWAMGGPIIEREQIDLQYVQTKKGGKVWRTILADGETPLIAAMRCFVGIVFGDEIEVPDQFKGE